MHICALLQKRGVDLGCENIPVPPDFNKLSRPYVVFENRLDAAQPAVIYENPVSVVCAESAPEIENAFQDIERGLARGLHAAGFLSFELGYAFAPKLACFLSDARPTRLLWMGLFHERRVVSAQNMDAAFAAIAPPPPLTDFKPTFDRHTHRKKVQTLLEHIAAGDAYQVNLTFPARFRYDADPLALYAAMRSSQPVAHGGLIAMADRTVLSVSPELLVEVTAGRATTRPMKGTAPRGRDANADIAAIRELAGDPKQRAENLMIVDLLRNDLGRISVPGSVKVHDLFAVETYPTLHTLTSTITATLRRDVGLLAATAALLPFGSVVGAPKHRAAELIHALEPTPRGVYTGAIGAFHPNGDFKFSVAIRTAVLDAKGHGEYGIGGGVVADSDPAMEYDECLLKARVMSDLATDYGLFETLRWTATCGFVRRDRHLLRLETSATQLGFAFDKRALLAQLDAVAARFADPGIDARGIDEPDIDHAAIDRRVRLEVRRNGKVDVSTMPLMPAPEHILNVGIAAERTDAADPFLRHKTTRRASYERAFSAGVAAGCDDMVFINQHGFVTEASRNNIFMQRAGKLITPALSAGLLPGILRQELLDNGDAIEGDITLDDLRQHAWFIGNSLRGLRLARLSE